MNFIVNGLITVFY